MLVEFSYGSRRFAANCIEICDCKSITLQKESVSSDM